MHRPLAIRYSGWEINRTATETNRRDRPLYEAGLRHFGTWKQALIAAGINPDHVRPYTRWRRPYKQQMLEAIIERSRQGLSIRWCDICRENFSFTYVVKNSLAVGAMLWLPPVSSRSQTNGNLGVKWNREKVIAALRAQKQRGLRRNRISKDDAALASAARRYFESLRDAVLAPVVEGS